MCTSDQIRFDPTRAGLQRLTARFGGHAYDLHRHETYAVGLTLWGAQSFHYRGELRTSAAGQIMVSYSPTRRMTATPPSMRASPTACSTSIRRR